MKVCQYFYDIIDFGCSIAMAMIDNSNVIDFSSRPRRVHQSTGKNYDGEGERNLELRGILDVLSAYKGYEGGINCSMCGELICDCQVPRY